LVNKPQVFGHIAQWLLLFLEYDFHVVYKPWWSHTITNVLSQFPNAKEPIGVYDQTIDAIMFLLQPKWLNSIFEFL
jgi:hypothetical protein